MRLLPELTPENTPYWTGGAQGQLLIAHCGDCDDTIHPPELICPRCLSRDIRHVPAAGTGVVYSYTVNYQPWRSDLTIPYVIAVVDLDGEPGVRVTGELLGVAPEAVAIGAAVSTTFLQIEDVWIPQFVPARAPATTNP